MKLTSLAQTATTQVSHNPKIGKQALIRQGEINHLTNFSRAVFPPGEIAPAHSHSDMTEVFFVESGEGEIEVDGQVMKLTAGSCITIEPGETHELRNPSEEAFVVLYFGVVDHSLPKG